MEMGDPGKVRSLRWLLISAIIASFFADITFKALTAMPLKNVLKELMVHLWSVIIKLIYVYWSWMLLKSGSEEQQNEKLLLMKILEKSARKLSKKTPKVRAWNPEWVDLLLKYLKEYKVIINFVSSM